MRQESCHKAPAMEEMREGGKSEKVVKLFGVRIAGDVGGGKAEDAATAAVAEEEDEEDVMRKSWSVGNLTSCSALSSAADHGSGDHGYHSDGGLLQSSSGKRKRRQERKKGVPWTKEEHRTFLAGLQKLGKGDWRGISQKFVTTRTPTQVASHAQKYFLRQNDHGKQKRRSSLFDVKINDEATGIETSLIPSSKKLKVVGEDIYHLSQKNNSTNFPAYFTSHVQTPAGEASSNFQHIANHSDMAGLSDNCAKEQPMNIPDEKGMQGQTKIACHPDLLRLSLSYSNCQTQSSPTTQINDLELRIAPPQPHNLSNMSIIVQQVK